MSCPLHSNDNSCAGCAKVKIQRLERQLKEANSMTEHYRNLWLEICISHNELNSKLQEQLKEKGDE